MNGGGKVNSIVGDIQEFLLHLWDQSRGLHQSLKQYFNNL